jgi:hypothetical protein
MALQTNIPQEKTPNGFSLPQAYSRITDFAYDVRTKTLRIQVETHANAAARQANKAAVLRQSFAMKVPADINLDQAMPAGLRTLIYGWLKNQAPFKGASDV